MALTPALDIGKRGLLAQEMALGIVGNNIANVNTPGYTRQVADFEQDPAIELPGGLRLGSGAHIASVRQVLDPFIVARLQASFTTKAERDTVRDQLERLSGLLNDLNEPSINDALSRFFDAADALARAPQGLTERQILLDAAHSVAIELNRRSEGLATLQADVDGRLVDRAAAANDDLARVAALDAAIIARESTGTHANDLRDKRQAILNNLAEAIGVRVLENPDGSVRVDAAGGGLTLIDKGVVINRIATRPDLGNPAALDGNTLHQLGLVNEQGTFLTVSAAFATGELAGLVRVRDGEIVTASRNVDNLASTLAGAVNAIQTDPAALDLDGNATTVAPLFSGVTAGTIAVGLTDPRRIAAALSAQPGDNQNALRLADLREAVQGSLGTTFNGYVALEAGRIGSDASLAADTATAAELLTTQLSAQRESLSGVNLNEELTNLLRFQRAFQASARVISIGNSILDDLLRMI